MDNSAYIPRKNTSRPTRSSARPGKRSERSTERPGFAATRPPFIRTGNDAKKPRWVPRTGKDAATSGTARTTTGASRPFSSNGVRPPSPFPQKPPYRPGGPDTTRKTFAPKSGTSYTKSYPPRPLKLNKPIGKSFGKPTAKPPIKFKPAKPPKTQLAKYAPKDATTSWGGVASWYDKHLESADTYHEKVILPNLLRLVDPQKSESILDLAAGQGAITRALAEKGAHLIGLDISPELIALATKKGGTGITYQTGNAEDLSVFTDEQFDKAVIVLAIQNIEYVQKVFNEAARVVKHDGTFHIVMNHPAFRIPKQSSWAYDEKGGVQYRRVDQYLSESRSTIDMHPGMENSPQTLSFHRPLQYYVKALVKAGFVVDRFEEWISHKDSDSGPRAKAENRARKEIPLFLYMRAKKL